MTDKRHPNSVEHPKCLWCGKLTDGYIYHPSCLEAKMEIGKNSGKR